MTPARKVARRRSRRVRPGQCAARGCGLTGFYAVSQRRKLCALHGAITLLARAVQEALARDNATGGR